MTGQQTLGRPVTLCGAGLHTGQDAVVRLMAAEPNSGIRFRVNGAAKSFPAVVDSLCSSNRCTGLGTAESRVLTVEHLLSALSGCEVDNCLVEVEGPEIPALDGSSEPFAAAIIEAGLVEQPAERRAVRIQEPVWVVEGESSTAVLPADGLRITCGIDFGRAMLGKQVFELEVEPGSYRAEIAPARTFGFLDEVEALHRNGLALGGSLENAVVISETEYLTPLRFPDEPVRHKVLDLIGDLALLGAPLQGHVVAFRPSHRINTRLVEEILKRF